MQIKKQQLKLDMEQQIDSKSGKEYKKAVYCHPAYLTYMQSFVLFCSFMKLLSHIWLFVTIQSMEFSRPEYWSG